MKLTRTTKIITISLCLAAVGVLLTWQNVLAAGLSDVVYYTVGFLAQLIVWLGGGLITLLVPALVWVAGYNDFTGPSSPQAIQAGWIVVRDFANMFFVIVLLVIAFATILRVESYQYKKLLPRLLLMAVLINFSKTIAGLIIDFGQVIMLTFVNAFATAAGGNFIVGFGINKLLDANPQKGADPKEVVVGYLLAIIYIVVAIVTLAVMTAVLVFRVIMLWLLVVLSPLAFFLSSFPQGQEYAKMWWQEFVSAVVIGPVLAFFIWMSLVAFMPVTGNAGVSALRENLVGSASLPSVQVGSGYMGDGQSMISFIMAIGMLWGGLYIAQKVGGVVGGKVGKMSDMAMKYASAPLRATGRGIRKWAVSGVKENVELARYGIASRGGAWRRFSPTYKKEREEGRQQRLSELTAVGRRRTLDKFAEAAESGSRWRAAMAMAGAPAEFMRRGRLRATWQLRGAGKSKVELERLKQDMTRTERQRSKRERQRKALYDPEGAERDEINYQLKEEKNHLAKLQMSKDSIEDGQKADSGADQRLAEMAINRYRSERSTGRQKEIQKLSADDMQNVENYDQTVQKLKNLTKDRAAATTNEEQIKIEEEMAWSTSKRDEYKDKLPDSIKNFDQQTEAQIEHMDNNSARVAMDMRIVQQQDNFKKWQKAADIANKPVRDDEDNRVLQEIMDEFGEQGVNFSQMADNVGDPRTVAEDPEVILNWHPQKIISTADLANDEEAAKFDAEVESSPRAEDIKDALNKALGRRTLK